MAIPSDHMPVGEGLSPDGSSGVMFFVDAEWIYHLEEHGNVQKYEDARFILESVSAPDAIFAGLNREEMEEGLCYSVRITHDPEEEGDPGSLLIPPHPGFVFLSYARIGVGGYLVFDWSWREEDPENPGHPLDWEIDFERRTWWSS